MWSYLLKYTQPWSGEAARWILIRIPLVGILFEIHVAQIPYDSTMMCYYY